MPPAPPKNVSTTPTASIVTTTVHVPQAVSTTTTTLGGAASVPTAPAPLTSNASQVPIAAIAGGTAAGVALALAAVIGWTWWGRCIKRKASKERKQALAFLEVRENTRKNSTTSTRPTIQQRSSSRGQQDRKVTFASTAPSSTQSTVVGAAESKTTSTDAVEKPVVRPPPVPRSPTPIAHLRIQKKHKPEVPPPPPVPHRNPRRGRAGPDASAPPDSYTQHRLMHQASTLSSASEYSTQSAAEERNSGVPASLLLALTNDGNRRSLLANYLPWSRHRTSTASGNRLSEYSTGSGYSQFDDQPWEPVGLAISGEEELPRGR